jgi:hypothetical protein
VAKARASKSNRGPTYPREGVPFIFFDDVSGVSSNKNTAKVYLSRNRSSSEGSPDDTRPEVVAELGMGLSTFAEMALNFYATLKLMMDDGSFHPETLKLVQKGLAHIEGNKTRVVESKAKTQKEKLKL